MAGNIRSSEQTLKLLATLTGSPASWHYGYALSRETGLLSGTLYPILMRLEQRGWLETRWETPPPESDKRFGRPPRHMYRLTPDGRARAVEALSVAGKRVKAHGSKMRRLAPQRADGV
ncbi:MAG TPA: PadR family transcriptional regulator [Candidatus Acidoferrales bacterium]|jgi:PadR family transcriptional regulator PadR|nr:PadR family transcriptional regulator [Candidatus Acidoferrales bacterium]